jgi:hypothetical protein
MQLLLPVSRDNTKKNVLNDVANRFASVSVSAAITLMQTIIRFTQLKRWFKIITIN